MARARILPSLSWIISPIRPSRTGLLRRRPALGLAAVAALIAAVTIVVLAVASDGSQSPGPSPGRPAPPWRVRVSRSTVPAPWAAAWDQAGNRRHCGLLFPLDGGPELAGATPTQEPTPGDKGWDIILTAPAGTVEIIGLFPRTTGIDSSPDARTFTGDWADGSTVRYAVDVGNAAPGTYDPDASPFEAVLTVPGQNCGYRIYDTLGRAHLEALFERLRLMRG